MPHNVLTVVVLPLAPAPLYRLLPAYVTALPARACRRIACAFALTFYPQHFCNIPCLVPFWRANVRAAYAIAPYRHDIAFAP